MPWNPNPKLLTHALFQFVSEENNELGRTKRNEATPATADLLRKLHRDFCAAFRTAGWDVSLADRHFHAFAEQVCNLKANVDQVVAVKDGDGQKAIEFHHGSWFHYSLPTKTVAEGKVAKPERM